MTATAVEHAQKIVAALIKALDDREKSVAFRAAYALGSVAAPAVPRLIAVLRERRGDMRARAAMALGCVVGEAVQPLPLLFEALGDSEAFVRTWAWVTRGPRRARPSLRCSKPSREGGTKRAEAPPWP